MLEEFESWIAVRNRPEQYLQLHYGRMKSTVMVLTRSMAWLAHGRKPFFHPPHDEARTLAEGGCASFKAIGR